ncbi:DNA alkylation repair protein [Buchananella hordeovulneris]|uniref:DNA alkylation repair protein n=1 Tax=Buchananella hordeovulneris TaxID=52770 RepID=UPI0026DD7996|nr:DNA alkylation repair protein [Buchananella hordeovulneris]MDO5081696.1 DNA alkylation repair protein [Buchananella hordeovulneris]
MNLDAQRLAALNRGEVATRTLSEALAIDQLALLQAVVPGAGTKVLANAAQASSLGISRRMRIMGQLLTQVDGAATLAHHPSDTVRGWMCFAISQQQAGDPGQLLDHLQPFADDKHFAVREWAWMAARPVLVRELETAIGLLVPWTAQPSERIRRFASEALRPRGVWASHIEVLKVDPSLGEPLLEPLRADPSRYVQDSVANWINDAAKTRPDWAVELCRRWSEDSPTPATTRITKRALRSVRQV